MDLWIIAAALWCNNTTFKYRLECQEKKLVCLMKEKKKKRPDCILTDFVKIRRTVENK